MITTLSESTYSIILTIAGDGSTAAFSIGIGVLLLVLLTIKHLAQSADSGFAVRLGRYVSIGIVPLVIGFGITTAFKLYQVMT
jgi:hypothetical protein